MTHQTLSDIFSIGFVVAYVTWGLLVVLIVRHLVRKDLSAFKVTLLYLINSVVFLLAWGIVLKLALIVLGPKDAAVLRQQADEHYMLFLRSSALVLLGLTLGNILYLKFIAGVAPLRSALILLVADAVILFSASYLSAEYYYLGLLPDTL